MASKLPTEVVDLAHRVTEREVDTAGAELAQAILLMRLLEVMKVVRSRTLKTGRRPVERAAAVMWLETELSNGPLDAGYVRARAEQAGIAWSTLRRASTQIGVVKQPPGRSCRWSIPGGENESRISVLGRS